MEETMTPPAPHLPLDGVRVLDLGQYISGPCTSVLLAEMGADVIKVEPPKGDPFRQWESGGLNATFVAFNRGKRSIALDLKDPDDLATLIALVETADVLVENFRPGVTERLGITHEVLSALNPQLVHCSITGFGSSGPYANLPAYDGVALGYSGLAGLLLDPDDPVLRGPALADAITGHTAAFNILAALIDRYRSDVGQHLEVSMLGALVHFLHSAVAKRIVEDREEGPYTRTHSSQAYVFVASDDAGLLIHLSSPTKFWEGLCTAVGRDDLIVDPRFRTRPKRHENYELLRTELRPIFARKPRDEWLELLQQHQVPCAPVNTVGEALEDEQLRHLGLIESFVDPDAGSMPLIRPPAHWNGAVLPDVRRAPYLGEHEKEILAELGTR
jgi:crotonobetainyl-CoA:carnitine CoA-transferase CaiB-like acyl-CoA transferase